MKRVLSLILALVIIISTLPAFAYTSEDDFEIINGYIFYYKGSSSHVDVPSTITKYYKGGRGQEKVIGINSFGYDWDEYNYNVTSVTLPEGVTHIGINSFKYTPNLHSISIPSTVRYIGLNAFEGTALLNNKTYTDGGFYIDNCLIKVNPKLKGTFTIKNGTRVIATDAFEGCYDITDVVIPDSVEYINHDAFSNTAFYYNVQDSDGALYRNGWLLYTKNTQLPENYNVKEGTKGIAGGAITNNDRLKSITFPDSLKVICDNGVSNNSNLSEINFNEGLEIIGDENFNGTAITSVSFPESVVAIDDWAFVNCKYLQTVDLPKNLTELRTNVFSSCNNIKTIFMYDKIWQVSWDCFTKDIYDDTPLEEMYTDIDIFYNGTSSQWNSILNYTNAEYHSMFNNANVILTYEVPDFTPIYIPQKLDQVTINGKGTAYARFIMTLKDGSGPARYRDVYYTIEGRDVPKKKVRTDINGCAVIPVDNITESGVYTIYISGPDVQGAIGSIKVTVEDLHFESEYEAQVMGGVRAGASLGVGGEVNELKAEASLGEVGASIGMTNGLSFKQEYGNNKQKVTLTAQKSYDGAFDGKVGLFAGLLGGETIGLEVNGLEIGGKVSVGGTMGATMAIDDFDYHDQTDLEQIGKFLVLWSSQCSPFNKLSEFIANKVDIPIESYESETSIGLSGETGIFVVDVKGNDGTDIGEFDIGNFGGSASMSSKTIKNTDGSIDFVNTLMKDAGASIFDFKKKNVRGSNFALGSSVYNANFVGNKVSLKADNDVYGNLEKLTYTTSDTNDSSIFWSKKKRTDKMSYVFEGADAENFANYSNTVYDFTKGDFPFYTMYEWNDVQDVLENYEVMGSFNTAREYKQGFDVDISGKVKCLGDLGISFGLSGIEGYEYEVENGLYENGTCYLQATNNIEDLVEDKFMGVEDLAYAALEAVADKVAEWFTYATVVLEDIKDEVFRVGKATIKKVGDKVTNLKVSVVNAIENFGSQHVLAVADETALFSTSSVATTIGEPYVIVVEDENGNRVTDFSESPILLTLEYTPMLLVEANVTDTSDISIIRWDDKKGVYVNVGGEHDADNMAVSLEITKPGQYILAVDNCPPAVTNFGAVDQSNSPEINATVSDFSGIEVFEFLVDGIPVVNNSNLKNYYDETTGAFKYVATGLDDGWHEGVICTTDTFGNITTEYMEFYVNTVTPEIGNMRTEKYDYSPAYMYVEIDDKDIETLVNANFKYVDIDGNTVTKSVELYDNWNGEYYCELLSVPPMTKVGVAINAVNEYGNSVSKEFEYTSGSLTILTEDNGYTVKVSIKYPDYESVKGCDLVIAYYDNYGKLTKTTVMDTDDYSYVNVKNHDGKIKVMVLNGIKPVCPPVILK